MIKRFCDVCGLEIPGPFNKVTFIGSSGVSLEVKVSGDSPIADICEADVAQTILDNLPEVQKKVGDLVIAAILAEKNR